LGEIFAPYLFLSRNLAKCRQKEFGLYARTSHPGKKKEEKMESDAWGHAAQQMRRARILLSELCGFFLALWLIIWRES
jgi:hypothetical protein